MPLPTQYSQTPKPGYIPNPRSGLGGMPTYIDWLNTFKQKIPWDWANSASDPAARQALLSGPLGRLYSQLDPNDKVYYDAIAGEERALFTEADRNRIAEFASTYRGDDPNINAIVPGFVVPGAEDLVASEAQQAREQAQANWEATQKRQEDSNELDRQIERDKLILGQKSIDSQEKIAASDRIAANQRALAALEGSVYGDQLQAGTSMYSTQGGMYNAQLGSQANIFNVLSDTFNKGESNKLNAADMAATLSLNHQNLLDDRVKYAIQARVQPGNFLQAEFANRGLNAPPGYNGPQFTDDPNYQPSIQKLMNYSPAAGPTPPASYGQTPVQPSPPQMPAPPNFSGLSGGGSSSYSGGQQASYGGGMGSSNMTPMSNNTPPQFPNAPSTQQSYQGTPQFGFNMNSQTVRNIPTLASYLAGRVNAGGLSGYAGGTEGASGYNIPPNILQLIYQYFQPQDIPKVLYLIQHESGFNPGAISPTGDYGLFQLNAYGGLGKGMTPEQMLDPETNIATAARAVYGGSGFRPWGEGTHGQAPYNPATGQGRFGALGNNPYPGDKYVPAPPPLPVQQPVQPQYDWIDSPGYGAGQGYYSDPSSNQRWTSELGWHGDTAAQEATQVFGGDWQTPAAPAAPNYEWIDVPNYGAGQGYYLDPVSGQGWTAEQDWHNISGAGQASTPAASPPISLTGSYTGGSQTPFGGNSTFGSDNNGMGSQFGSGQAPDYSYIQSGYGGYAGGTQGMTTENAFMAGDVQQPGVPNPEAIVNPTGAPIGVMNAQQIQQKIQELTQQLQMAPPEAQAQIQQQIQELTTMLQSLQQGQQGTQPPPQPQMGQQPMPAMGGQGLTGFADGTLSSNYGGEGYGSYNNQQNAGLNPALITPDIQQPAQLTNVLGLDTPQMQESRSVGPSLNTNLGNTMDYGQRDPGAFQPPIKLTNPSQIPQRIQPTDFSGNMGLGAANPFSTLTSNGPTALLNQMPTLSNTNTGLSNIPLANQYNNTTNLPPSPGGYNPTTYGNISQQPSTGGTAWNNTSNQPPGAPPPAFAPGFNPVTGLSDWSLRPGYGITPIGGTPPATYQPPISTIQQPRNPNRETLPSNQVIPDSYFQNQPILQYLKDPYGQASMYSNLSTANRMGPFGMVIPGTGGLNYNSLLNVAKNPIDAEMLNAILGTVSSSLGQELARTRQFAPLGNGLNSYSGIRTI